MEDEQATERESYISSECLKGLHGDCEVAACKDDCHGADIEEDAADLDEIF